jgi:hypothetical protein
MQLFRFVNNENLKNLLVYAKDYGGARKKLAEYLGKESIDSARTWRIGGVLGVVEGGDDIFWEWGSRDY